MLLPGTFAQLRDRYFVFHLDKNPVTSTYLGGDGYSPALADTNTRLRDYRQASHRRRAQEYRSLRASIAAIPVASLVGAEKTDQQLMLGAARFSDSSDRRAALLPARTRHVCGRAVPRCRLADSADARAAGRTAGQRERLAAGRDAIARDSGLPRRREDKSSRGKKGGPDSRQADGSARRNQRQQGERRVFPHDTLRKPLSSSSERGRSLQAMLDADHCRRKQRRQLHGTDFATVPLDRPSM